MLSQNAPLIAAAGTATRLLSMYNGEIQLKGVTSSGLADMAVVLQEANTGSPVMTVDPNVFNGQTDANGNLIAQIVLPNVQCVAILTNKNAAAQTCKIVIAIDGSGEG